MQQTTRRIVTRRRTTAATEDKAPAPVARSSRTASMARQAGAERQAVARRASAASKDMVHIKKIQNNMAELAALDLQMQELATEREALITSIRTTYEEHGLTGAVEGHGYIAHTKQKQGRASTTVFTDKVYKLLVKQKREKEFWEHATIPVKALDSLFAEKERGQVMERTEGVKGPIELVVEQAPTKRK